MDILSDDSDSFFEDPKKLKAKKSKIQSGKSQQSVSVQNLFGIEPDKDGTPTVPEPVVPKSAINRDADWLGLGDDLLKTDRTTNKPISTASRVPQKKISFEDDDDLPLGGFESKPKKSAEDFSTKARKSAIMEDLLGGPGAGKQEDTKKLSSFEDILQMSKAKKELALKTVTDAPPEMSKEPPASAKAAPSVAGIGGSYAPSSAGREGRRSRHALSNITSDPLGIFASASETVPEKPPPAPELFERKRSLAPQRSTSLDLDADVGPKPGEKVTPKLKDTKAASSPNLGLPNWLGGAASKPETVPEIPKEQPSLNATVSYINPNYLNASQESFITQQKLSTSNLELQNAQITLQQQESQVLMALQLRKYEDSLAEMQRSQQDLIIKQEQQFNALLERQFSKQQIMENNMRLQQERINNHIQLLIAQPPVSGERLSSAEKQREELKEVEMDGHREVIENLKQKHHEEMFLIEESYKKQISLIEQNTESLETRLKQEIQSITDHFNEKIQNSTIEHNEEITKYKQKLDELRQQHVAEIKTIRENHARVCEEIRYEYSTMMENVKESRKTEKAMTENAEEYSVRLRQSLQLLDSNNRSLDVIKSEMEAQKDANHASKEKLLDTKEEELRFMRRGLEKVQESMQLEKAQLLGLIRGLETKLAEQTQATREEQWALQQATAVLTARAAALDREAEFARNAADREREQVKILKETLLAEQERNALHFTEEKLALAAERSRLETSSKLKGGYDADKARAEIDAAIQVAKEAAEMTDRERERLQKQQFEVEGLKRQLKDREFKLGVKEKEMERMERSGLEKLEEGQRMVDEAKRTESKCNEKMKEIQSQLQMLKFRERKMNEDKIYLSKERLALQETLAKVSKKCGLCTVENNPPAMEEQVGFYENVAELEIPKYSISNPELLRFRMSLGLEDENGEANSQ